MKTLKFFDPNLELGESHSAATERIVSLVNNLRLYHSNKTILLVIHGTLLTLFMANYYNFTLEETIKYWKNISFCQLEFV